MCMCTVCKCGCSCGLGEQGQADALRFGTVCSLRDFLPPCSMSWLRRVALYVSYFVMLFQVSKMDMYLTTTDHIVRSRGFLFPLCIFFQLFPCYFSHFVRRFANLLMQEKVKTVSSMQVLRCYSR
jgi:hypothetical protein